MSDADPRSRTAYDKMLAGEIYEMPDWDLLGIQAEAAKNLARLNAIPNGDYPARQVLLKELLGRYGESMILSPIVWEYGKHIEVGDSTFINVECIFLDGARITIGDRCAFGPRVQLLTAGHPVKPSERSRFDESGKWIGANNINAPITIGDDCWIGAGTIVQAGVTIGNGTTIGAGSVVTRDVPPNVFAAGNPCRVIREIT